MSYYSEYDARNGRILVGWEKDGIVHKTNYLLHGWSRIVQHAHSYGHWYEVWNGTLRLTDTAPDGSKAVSTVSVGDKLFMPARHEHAFDRLDTGTEAAIIDCFWPEGADQ